jgi:threonine dehydrogenase-like Zn-dependent dehydrogenase
MKTKAVRLYGKKDLRLEEFELPSIKDVEILAHVVTDSICMSSYKAALQGSDHKRIPQDIDQNPIVIGHEFAGEILEVGSKWRDRFKAGTKFAIQPALNYKGSMAAPGYSYPYLGGDATHVILPPEVMELGCLLDYRGRGYFHASLSEPMSCIVAAFHAAYHTVSGKYVHHMGIVEGGNMAILAAAGPMGMGAIDYAIHCGRKPGLLVVTDIDEKRLNRASALYPVEEARRNGVSLRYVNTREIPNAAEHLLEFTSGKGFDDVLVFAPVKSVVEDADKILGRDGCLNFFAGPTDPGFSAEINFYNVHYSATHLTGTSGGNTEDMIESLELMGEGLINPATMVTHIGGLNSVVDTTLNLPKIPGGKKLIYTNIEMELTAINDFPQKAASQPLFGELARIVEDNNGLWSVEAEKYLLENAKPI